MSIDRVITAPIRGAALIVGLIAGLVVAAAPVAASPVVVTLDYQAPAACPDEISLRAGVIARLGHDPFVTAAPAVVPAAEVSVRAAADGFHGRVALVEGGAVTSERVLPPQPDCRDTVTALELALAMLIERAGAPAGGEPPVAVVPAASPSTSPPPAPIPREPPGWREPPAAPPPRLSEITVGGALETGRAPESSGVFVIEASRGRGRWRLGARFGASQHQLDFDSVRSGSSSHVEMLAVACWRRGSLGLCGRAGGGRASLAIERDNGDFTSDTLVERTAGFLSIGAAVELVVPLGELVIVALDGGLGLVGPFDRAVGDGMVLWEPSPLATTLGLRIGLRI